MIGSVLFASSQVKTPAGFRHRLSLLESDSQMPGIGISRLGVFELFTGLDIEAIAEIAACARESWVRSGTQVIRQGQYGKEVFFLEQGAVGIYAESGGAIQLLTVLEGPTVFGEMAVVTKERVRSASVEAVTDLKLLAIRIDDLLGFLKRFDALRTNLRRMVAARTPRV